MQNIFTLLDELRTLAQQGLLYAQDPYDRARYERLLEIATEYYGQTLDLPAAEVKARFARELGHVTPKIGGDAAIFNERGEILLTLRADNQQWCLPCGYVDANEDPADTALREAWEETGLRVQIRELVGTFFRPASPVYGPHSLLAVVYWCEVLGGELTLSHESLELRYWDIERVPIWHGIHERYARVAYQRWRAASSGDGG